MPWNGVGPQSPSYNGSEDSGSPRRSSSKDRKVMSLKMCFISRNLTMPDLENRSDFNINIVLCCCDGIKKCGWSVCVCFLKSHGFGDARFRPTPANIFCLCSFSDCWSSIPLMGSTQWYFAVKMPPLPTPGSLPSTPISPPCSYRLWLTSMLTWEPLPRSPHSLT